MDAGDASALEKHYHKSCLRIAQRQIKANKDHDNESLIRSLCDEQLILAVQNTLKDEEDVMLDMSQVNDAYLSILKRYRVDVDETTNHRKYLKKIIQEQLPDVQFVRSLRRNEPDRHSR